jgi:hypothetical protein
VKKFVIAEVILTLLQLFLFGFSFSLLLCIIGRFLFFLKLMGTGVKLGWSIGFEAAAVFFIVLIPVFFNSRPELLTFLGFTIAAIISTVLAVYDDAFYIYTEEDI